LPGRCEGVAGAPVVAELSSGTHFISLRSYLKPLAFFSASLVAFMDEVPRVKSCSPVPILRTSRIAPGGSDRAGPCAAHHQRPVADSGTFFAGCGSFVCLCQNNRMELQMNGLIYLIGLIVVIMAVLSLFGLR
jgi:hypothetical protein